MSQLPHNEPDSIHRLTKKVKRWVTPQKCHVESRRTLLVDSMIIIEEIVLSTTVDLPSLNMDTVSIK